MSTLPTSCPCSKRAFDIVASPFVHDAGLPFAGVLDARTIEEAFAAEDGLFATEDLFSTPIVLWAFLAQALRDGKEAACCAAVNDIAMYLIQSGRKPPSGDTGDYCRARAKLSLPALRRLVMESAQALEQELARDWLWHGLHAKLVDGFTVTMPDTPENQAEFPQNPAQVPGVGLPIARACAVISLATGCVCDLALGPYSGKGTGEPALLRSILAVLGAGEVAVFDRCYCSYLMLAALSLRGVEVCARSHQRRLADFRRGRRLGDGDHLISWARPTKPDWMDEEEYHQIPETLTLREMQIVVKEPGSRVEFITLITTLTDPKVYPKEDVAKLYRSRWHVELDIRSIKHPLSLDHLRCKTPHMVRREVWVTLLAYNLIRRVMALAAKEHRKEPRQLSFTGACQVVLSCWALWATGVVSDPAVMRAAMLKRIASEEAGHRSGRVEPRVLKRRRHRYPLMKRPRKELREALCKHKYKRIK
jgi:hypothetical protein